MLTADGSHTLFSETYGVSYHSKYGALQETQHVFIDAGLHHVVAQGRRELHVLDIGFGTGLNALMSLVAAQKEGLVLHYHAVEKYPLSMEAVAALNYPALLPEWAGVFQNMHAAPWGEAVAVTPQVTLVKQQEDFLNLDFTNRFDVVYFDAFAPESQPELWTEVLLAKMYAALKSQGVLTTYCAKGVVKRTLRALGFVVEPLPGPPGKREMTRATKP